MELAEKKGDMAYLEGYLTLKEMLDIGMLVVMSDIEDEKIVGDSTSDQEPLSKE
ncbi:hypothetical protein [Veronia nyctiphanis]|uniref:hypothetical protein n=1 Tax=Veronia nyctiphanis TaxID=1278244 RepID=UPI00191BF66A|nr:hypothetical protein [Veronia nyctiphanis]